MTDIRFVTKKLYNSYIKLFMKSCFNFLLKHFINNDSTDDLIHRIFQNTKNKKFKLKLKNL